MKKIIAVIMSCIVMLNVTVFANADVSYDRDTGRVIVSGKLDAEKKIDIAITVYHADKLPGVVDLDDYASFSGFLSAIRHIRSDAKGNYSDAFMLSGESGNYLVRVKPSSSNVVSEKIIAYVSQNLIIEYKQKLNDAKTAEGMKALILDNQAREVIGFKNDLFHEVQNKEVIYSALSNIVCAAPYVNLKDAIRDFNDAVLMQRIKEVSDSDAVNLIINKSKDTSIANTKQYELFAKSSNIRIPLVAKLKKSNITNTAGFNMRFQELCILFTVQYAVGWGEVKTILNNNRDLLAIPSVKDEASACQSVTGKEYDTLLLFYNAYANGGNPPDKNNPGGGSGGGGTTKNITAPNFAPTDERNLLGESAGKVLTFADVTRDYWAYDAITKLAEKGVVSGSFGLFNPETMVTREEFAKMLVNVLGLSIRTGDSGFADVIASEWYAPYVYTAKEHGLVNGESKSSFGIGKNITRVDMTVMLARALGDTMNNNAITFVDTDQIPEYGLSAVAAMVAFGDINGFPDGTFKPLDFANRAEAATAIYRLWIRRGKS